MKEIIDKDMGKLVKETEMFRMWEPIDKKIPEDEKGDEIIEVDGIKLNLVGFTTFKEKNTKKLVFAYKFKHDTKTILYYVPEMNKEVNELIHVLNTASEIMGYDFNNLDETLKSAVQEMKLLRKDK